MNSESSSTPNRRQFLKTAGAFAIVGASASKAFAVEGEPVEYHICQGLNTQKEGSLAPGTALGPNLPNADLHSCMGGNTCAGLGACGTGEYARQYWITENLCKNTAGSAWNGTGGCGVPIGTGNTGYVSTQLNNAAPTEVPGKDGEMYPSDFLGQPVWNIARSRFEEKMYKNKKKFDAPANLEAGLFASSWDGTGEYKRVDELPVPYPQPQPPKVPKPS